MRGIRYQLTLIISSIVVTLLFAYFFYAEIFPEYRIYQDDYIALEDFRSSYTGEPPPPFESGVKQIVIHSDDGGPPVIDRCISCHVALKFEHFSPTKLAYDVNGNLILDADGVPKKVPNEQYIWKKLDEKIAYLKKQGDESGAERLEALKVAHVGDHTYDVTKVLQMHPLIGKETRPFEYHPIDEYGCTSCHSGNGRGLTTDKAHGPVFDGQYEAQFLGEVPQFLEKDPHGNDPVFSKAYNDKPGHKLLFQTTPLLVGGLIDAKCIQCHKTSQKTFADFSAEADITTGRRIEKINNLKEAYNSAAEALAALYTLNEQLKKEGLDALIKSLDEKSRDDTLPESVRDRAEAQVAFLRKNRDNPDILNQEITLMIGTPVMTKLLERQLRGQVDKVAIIKAFVEKHHKDSDAIGTLFAQANTLEIEKALIDHLHDVKETLGKTTTNKKTLSALGSEVDLLTQTYQRGEELYLSQACYACHRIRGLARGGVGPELTEEGFKDPWFIKESITWPQADLKTSTMPNYNLDHDEIEALMTFLVAQTGSRKADSESAYKRAVLEWEAGAKLPWEKPVSPDKMHDLRYSMTIFAEEGCAACHRLKGYEASAGFAVEKGGAADFDTLYREQEWFQKLFPEEIRGSDIVKAIETHKEEIDKRIVDGVRENALLDEIEAKSPGLIESFYANFKYALRAKNHEGEEASKRWQERVRRLMMVYVEQYGLGRLVGPRPNWSGIYRTDEWLMEHFRNPSSLAARSIMPVFPFDESKFSALTHMINVLSVRNRDAVRTIWKERGFNPEQAYNLFCAQCHGEYMQGNGPVTPWIYPIPKNLRNADFLRYLTRERAYESIVHGVKGTPMPPWSEVASGKPDIGDVPVIKEDEVLQIVDWIFSLLPGGTVIRGAEDVPKWQYGPEELIEELKREGRPLKGKPEEEKKDPLSALPTGSEFSASLTPTVAVNEEKPPSAAVSQYFDIVPHPVGETEKEGYYIKKRFYTPENLTAGEAFFRLNCTVCHGNDADGAGSRAMAMDDAKPRMLTNLNWLGTRDDLRLLRSIKYGVAGTSMAPWGDRTNALQRLQLVMFIRSISAQAKQRSELMSALYDAFNQAVVAVESARIQDSPTLADLREQIEVSEEQQAILHRQARLDAETTRDAVESYRKQLSLFQQKVQHEQLDALLERLIEEIRTERAKFKEVGLSLIKESNDSIDPKLFNSLIRAAEGRFSFNGSTLTYTFTEEQAKLFDSIGKTIIGQLQGKEEKLKQEQERLKGRIHSAERSEQLRIIDNSLSNIMKLERHIIQVIEYAKRARQQQQLVEQYNRARGQIETE